MENFKILEASIKDKEFIIQANNQINILSGLNDSKLEENIERDIFSNEKSCKCFVAKDGDKTIGMILYSYIYWANLGKGIYLSQVYIIPEYRKKGILKKILNYIKLNENSCKFITAYIGQENINMKKSFQNLGAKNTDLSIYYLGINDIL